MTKKEKIREAFRNAVFERDGFKCRICGRSICKLDAHHIQNRKEMPNGGYVLENGITLCDDGQKDSCHYVAEDVYFGREIPSYRNRENYTSDALYKLIGSSKELAYQKSLELE